MSFVQTIKSKLLSRLGIYSDQKIRLEVLDYRVNKAIRDLESITCQNNQRFELGDFDDFDNPEYFDFDGISYYLKPENFWGCENSEYYQHRIHTEVVDFNSLIEAYYKLSEKIAFLLCYLNQNISSLRKQLCNLGYNINLRELFRAVVHFLFKNLDDESSHNLDSSIIAIINNRNLDSNSVIILNSGKNGNKKYNT